MIEFVNQINSILDLIVKVSIITGIGFLVYFFIKLKFLDSKIEHKYKKFEEERDGERGQGRGIPESIINDKIEYLRKKKAESIAPLERERKRIITKIPFLK